MTINKIIIIIITIIILVLIGAGLAFLAIQSKIQEVNFSPEEYAKDKGYEKWFQHEGQWYENIDGGWKAVEYVPIGVIEAYAKKNGYTEYLRYLTQWYTNNNGKWQLAEGVPFKAAEDYAKKNGFTKYFQFSGQWFAISNGKWVTTNSLNEAKMISGEEEEVEIK